MKFMNELKNQTNVAITENGALGYKTTFNALLDFNYKVPSLRKSMSSTLDVREVINSITDLETLYRYIFFLRDVRGGMGERKLFREFIGNLAKMEREELKMVIPLIPEYGRWDDLFVLFNTPYEMEAMELIVAQLHNDVINASQGKPISLLAKWMPSNNASSKNTKALAQFFTQKFQWTPKQYRKTLSHLRYYLKVTEAQISRQEFDKIAYESVPSYANLRYAKLFLDRDYDRRKAFLDSLKKGEVTVKASTLYPQEVIAKLRGCKSSPALVEGLWKGLREFGEVKNVLVVADVSGSMTVPISNSVQAIDASVGLGIYFAERNTGEFKDKVVTFSEHPSYVDLSNCKTLFDKYQKLYQSDWGFSTNIEAVFNLVLETAKASGCSQEEIPEILILSDMEFNSCTTGSNKKLFKDIERRFRICGYKLPKLSFWNLNSRSNTIPLIENDLGVTLVSGYSPASIGAVLGGKIDPYEALMDCIFVERYDKIAETIKDYVNA